MSLICLSIYAKMHGFFGECLFSAEIQVGKTKNSEKQIFFRKVTSRLCKYPGGKKFHLNQSILIYLRYYRFFIFSVKKNHCI